MWCNTMLVNVLVMEFHLPLTASSMAFDEHPNLHNECVNTLNISLATVNKKTSVTSVQFGLIKFHKI